MNSENEKRLSLIINDLYTDFMDNCNMTSKDFAREAAYQYADYLGAKMVKKFILVITALLILLLISVSTVLMTYRTRCELRQELKNEMRLHEDAPIIGLYVMPSE